MEGEKDIQITNRLSLDQCGPFNMQVSSYTPRKKAKGAQMGGHLQTKAKQRANCTVFVGWTISSPTTISTMFNGSEENEMIITIDKQREHLKV